MEENISKLDELGITLRKVKSTDLFLMTTIISKLGINDFIKCINSDGVQGLINSITEKTKNNKKEENANDDTIKVGIGVALEIANIILTNLYKCEKEVYQLFANLTDKAPEEIKDLDIDVFLEMIITFVKKDEFKDFFKAASRFLKQIGLNIWIYYLKDMQIHMFFQIQRQKADAFTRL